MARKKTRRDEMVDLLALREREGLTFRELSERCGVPSATLNWWSRKLRRERRPSTFTELEVVDEQGTGGRPSGIRVRVGDVFIEVDGAFQVEVLARVLDVVQSRC